jgi:hypothetical protein
VRAASKRVKDAQSARKRSRMVMMAWMVARVGKNAEVCVVSPREFSGGGGETFAR